jgi:hypothetical protein
VLSHVAAFFLYGRTNVAQTLLSVLVRLAKAEKINTSANTKRGGHAALP